MVCADLRFSFAGFALHLVSTMLTPKMSSTSYYNFSKQAGRKLTCAARCTPKSENVASSMGWVWCRFSNLTEVSVFWWNAAKRALYCVTFSIMLSFQRHKPVCYCKASPHDDQWQICSSDPLMEAEFSPHTDTWRQDIKVCCSPTYEGL